MSETVKKYDYVLYLGKLCHGASLVNNNGLKLFDGPWDWSGTGKADGIYKRIKALYKDFDHWFDYKDFVPMKPEYAAEIGNFTWALRYKKDVANQPQQAPVCKEVPRYNPKTLTYYYHDFFDNKPVEEQFPAFKEKYLRRCERCRSFIEAADSVLLIYMSHLADQKKDVRLDDTRVVSLIKRLREKYPSKTIDLYMFEHSPNFHDGNYIRSVLDIGIIRYISNHDEVFPENDDDIRHRANTFMMPKSVCKILEHIKLSDKFKMI